MAYSDLDRPPLDGAAIRHALVGPGTWWRDVVVTARTTSTNADLAALAHDGAPEGTLVTTDHQTAGRGRLDRRWESPAAAAITLSVLVRPDLVPDARWPWLPLLVGVAVVEAVHEVAGVEAALKWPNDVVVGDRKLAGILLERVQTPTGAAAVIGVGLNVTMRESERPVPQATSLALEGGRTTDRSVVLRAFARTFEPLYRAWAGSEGDASTGLLESYVRRCSTLGQEVEVSLPAGSRVQGSAVAIDSTGRLVVDVDGHQQALSAGDITHLRPRT